MKWISVKEGLPLTGNIVLMAFPNDQIFTGYQVGKVWRNSSGRMVSDEVTHWMELPEPPSPDPFEDFYNNEVLSALGATASSALKVWCRKAWDAAKAH